MSEQTGLFSTGDVSVYVGGNTDLLSSVIGSEEGIVTIDAATLTHADLTDHNAYNDFGVSVTLNASMFMPPKTPEETARDVAQQNAACQAIGGCTSPNWSTQGHLAFDDGAQNTNATIGVGEGGTVSVSIRDEAAQQELKDSGQTAGVDEINSDLDTAQVVTRDEHERVDFYLSDSSLQAAADAVSFVGKTVAQGFESLMAAMASQGNLTAEEQEIFNEVAKGFADGTISPEDFVNCAATQQHGFNLFNMIFGTAHAANGCSGAISKMTKEQRKKCLIYLLFVNEKILAAKGSSSHTAGVWIGAAKAFGSDLKAMAILLNHATIIVNESDKDPAYRSDAYWESLAFTKQIAEGVKNVVTNYEQIPGKLGAWFDKKYDEYLLALAAGDSYRAGQIYGEITYKVMTAAYFVKGAGKALVSASAGLRRLGSELRGRQQLGGRGQDGAGVGSNSPNMIEYDPPGSVVSQGNNPHCGPACTTMIVRDAKGNSIDLNSVVNQFDEVRPTGVNINEISTVLNRNGVSNTSHTTMTSIEVRAAIAEGKPVIVQVPAPGGRHFIIVDGIRTQNGVAYYLTRDPAAGARGIRVEFIDRRMTGNGIVIGE